MKFYRVKNKAGEVHVIADRDLGPQYQVLSEVDHPANPKPKVMTKADKPALPAGLMRIVDPKRPGAFLVLAEREFDPTKHERFVEAPAKPPVPAKPDAPVPEVEAPAKPEPVAPQNSKSAKGRENK